jgi:hypothetical protein
LKWHESQSSTNNVINQNMQPQTWQGTYLTSFSSPLSLIQEWHVYCAKVIYVHTVSLLWWAKKQSCDRPCRPRGFQEVKVSRFLDVTGWW